MGTFPRHDVRSGCLRPQTIIQALDGACGGVRGEPVRVWRRNDAIALTDPPPRASAAHTHCPPTAAIPQNTPPASPPTPTATAVPTPTATPTEAPTPTAIPIGQLTISSV